MAFNDSVSQAGLALLHSFHGMKLEQQPSSSSHQHPVNGKNGRKSRKDFVPSLLRLDTVDSELGSEEDKGEGTIEGDGLAGIAEKSASDNLNKVDVRNCAAELVSHSRTRTVLVPVAKQYCGMLDSLPDPTHLHVYLT